MTYILGLKQPGINAIICDARKTWSTTDGENSSVKTGLLFPGCIYGRIGNVDHSQKFIRSFRDSIDGQTATIQGFWQKLVDFVASYPFSTHPGEQFELLISTRATGTPQFHKMRSNRELSTDTISHENYICSFGSGCELLDPYVLEIFTPRIEELQKFLVNVQRISVDIIRRITPYFLCLWLSELSLTFEKSRLEEHGVGGVFHFIYQTDTLEEPQGVAIYMFSMADRINHSIYTWFYKVIYLQGGVYMEEHMPPNQDERFEEGRLQRYFNVETVSRPDFIDEPKIIIANLIEEELKSKPFYNFCGFGFAYPNDRKSFGFLASNNGKKEEIFVNNTQLLPWINEQISSNFESN